ncbi:MAG: hypothetical protein R2748_29740 [Bryobacterales bacterium]
MRCFALLAVVLAGCSAEPELSYQVRQLTFGPAHHFYGYIGHVGNSPYSADGRYLIALRTTFQDRMPGPDDVADIVLLDAAHDYAETKVEETRGWNPQQGAMLYWNPQMPTTQFFFNDRDPETGKVFTAVYDLVEGKRVREYRFEDSPVGNSGVKQDGGAFAAINYARMARLRPVTGYPGAWDWTEGVDHPADDGLFVVDEETGEREPIVSFERMRDALVEKYPAIDGKALFLNHTLWNREGDRIFFFVRGDFADRENRINVPMTVRPDGSELTEQMFIGGHPEWDFGSKMIGKLEYKLVLYDALDQRVVETIGGPEIFPDPGGDTALSSDGDWLVNGATDGSRMFYSVLRRSDGAYLQTEDFVRSGYERGDLRIDPAPCWNREGDRFAFPALAKDWTRQLFEVRVIVDH